MRTQLIQKLGAPLLAGSMALSATALAAQGLYSADELMDADVYDSTGELIGEVEDILLGNDMSLHSLIIETDAILGLGGREVIAERGTFTVRVEPAKNGVDFDDMDYRVLMEGTQDMVKQLPEYNEGWWIKTKNSLSKAWANTKNASESAWESTKEATSSAWHNVRDGAKNLGNKATEVTK